ncbi:uncharacterized protein LOC118478291 [Aplysia californica]|uniref:Uncharacterized protein LOC118478291 n=1 Tax=Aplysia californica TaxID=6500 RepID=A0ABM1VYL1_APLCA|nr:uncharacterized protein LOC118478291 [Aplysia californica]
MVDIDSPVQKIFEEQTLTFIALPFCSIFGSSLKECVHQCESCCGVVLYSESRGVCETNSLDITDSKLDFEKDDFSLILYREQEYITSPNTQSSKQKVVFRAFAGIGKSVYERWTETGVNDDFPVTAPSGCLNLSPDLPPCDKHYRSAILDNWPSDIKTVYIHMYKDGAHKKEFSFYAVHSRANTWLRIGFGSDSDEYYSISGEVNGTHIQRRFYYLPSDYECGQQSGYFFVFDSTSHDECAASWKDQGFPVFIWKLGGSALYESADVFEIAIETYDQDSGP